MIAAIETCKCGRTFLRGIYPQKKCYICDIGNPIIYSHDSYGTKEIISFKARKRKK